MNDSTKCFPNEPHDNITDGVSELLNEVFINQNYYF